MPVQGAGSAALGAAPGGEPKTAPRGARLVLILAQPAQNGLAVALHGDRRGYIPADRPLVLADAPVAGGECSKPLDPSVAGLESALPCAACFVFLRKQLEHTPETARTANSSPGDVHWTPGDLACAANLLAGGAGRDKGCSWTADPVPQSRGLA